MDNVVIPIRSLDALTAIFHLPISLHGARLFREDKDTKVPALVAGYNGASSTSSANLALLDIVNNIVRNKIFYNLYLSDAHVRELRNKQVNGTDERYTAVLRALLPPLFKQGDVVRTKGVRPYPIVGYLVVSIVDQSGDIWCDTPRLLSLEGPFKDGELEHVNLPSYTVHS